MTYEYESVGEGCLIICIVLAAWALVAFGMPWVCMMGWAPIATGFNLPTFTYWNWFWMSWMIRWLFKGGTSTGVNVREKKKR